VLISVCQLPSDLPEGVLLVDWLRKLSLSFQSTGHNYTVLL